MANVLGLDAYVAETGALPAIWGRRDCCLFVADWIVASTGVDPARAWRGSYASQSEAYRALRRAGGFVAAISREMDGLGFAQTADPLPGDVAIVDVVVAIHRRRPIHRPVAAIRVGRLWAVKAPSGMAAGNFTVRVAWRIDPR